MGRIVFNISLYTLAYSLNTEYILNNEQNFFISKKKLMWILKIIECFKSVPLTFIIEHFA